jgi:hypothetical protein
MLGEAYQAYFDPFPERQAFNLGTEMTPLYDETTSQSDAEPSEAKAATAWPARRARRVAIVG